MKTRNLLAVIVFMAAIGSAIASGYLVPFDGYTSKSDVPIQAEDCELRQQCNGTASACSITIDHDGDSGTLPISVPLRDGNPKQGSPCGVQLMRN